MDPKLFNAQITARAWKDPDFKERLLANPKKILETEYEIKLPDQTECKVLEETPSTTYLVLPRQPDDVAPEQLSDRDLETVAGGAASNTNVMSGCSCCSSPCGKLGSRWSTGGPQVERFQPGSPILGDQGIRKLD